MTNILKKTHYLHAWLYKNHNQTFKSRIEYTLFCNTSMDANLWDKSFYDENFVTKYTFAYSSGLLQNKLWMCWMRDVLILICVLTAHTLHVSLTNWVRYHVYHVLAGSLRYLLYYYRQQTKYQQQKNRPHLKCWMYERAVCWSLLIQLVCINMRLVFEENIEFIYRTTDRQTVNGEKNWAINTMKRLILYFRCETCNSRPTGHFATKMATFFAMIIWTFPCDESAN